MPNVKWSDPARADLLNIVGYISEDNPDAAQRLKDEIETKAEGLAQRPRLYRVGRMIGTREMVVRRNYVVVYRETIDRVEVLRVIHTARQWP